MIEKMILLPLDGSKASISALIPAKSLSVLFNIPLYILYVSDKKFSRDELISKLNINPAELPRFVLLQKSGDPSEVIISEMKNAKFLVMGTHGETANMDKLIGSVTKKVMEVSEVPVLMIHPRMKINLEKNMWVPKKVLIPLNGTIGASHTLGSVIEILVKASSSLNLLHIVQIKPDKSSETMTTPYYIDFPQFEWNCWSKEFIRRFGPILHNHNHISYELSLLRGDPGEEIISFAKNHNNDLIAMTWHGDLSEKHALILKKVMKLAPCPTLLVRTV
jgi:nucleotide-binding universal stress UspA family protein